MLSGFQTGNNKKLELVQNDKINKIVLQFEELSQEEEQLKSENKATKNDLNLLNSISKEVIKTNTHLYHPSKFAEQEFKFLLKSDQKLSEKKISFQTVIMGEEGKKEIETPIKQIMPIQENIAPLQMNGILLSKISKLSKCLLGEKFFQLQKEFMKNAILRKNNYTRTQIDLSYNWALVKQYFTQQYIVEKDWLKHQAKLITWKLKCKNQFSDTRLLLELEYRYFIQYRLQSRTVIQEIYSGDQKLNQHMVLLVVSIEKYQNKKIIELSDGWYSIFFISEELFQEEYSKIKIGQKLHFINLHEYPVIINTQKIYTIMSYPFQKMLVTTKINSIKKASISSKLGKQQSQYFLRSIKSLRGGIIPCIDVFVVSKSYLIKVNEKKQKQAIIFNKEESFKGLQFIILVFDSLHYFDGKKKIIDEFKEIVVHIEDQIQYEMIQTAQRIKIINAIQINNEISIKLGKNSGIITDLQQYPEYYNKIKLKHNRYEIQLTILNQYKQENFDIIEGLNENNLIVKIEIHSCTYFSESLKNQNYKIIKFTQLKQFNSERFQTTQLSKLININYIK